MRKHYDARFKAEAVLEVLRGENTLAAVASQRQVRGTVLHRWRQLAIEGMPKVFAHADQGGLERAEYEKKIHELDAEIGRLSPELEWLKKAIRSE